MAAYTETQLKILEIGKKEFLAKGYKDASLRGIVREAGFTQGAFYGYYPDKAALFDALVSEAADGLLEKFKSAQQAHYDLIPQGKTAQNFDAFKLVICCSEGTRYASYISDLVEIEVTQTQRYYEQLRQMGRLEGTVSPELHHMITSAYFTAVFETVAHDMSREKAIVYVNELATFFNCGWVGLLRLD